MSLTRGGQPLHKTERSKYIQSPLLVVYATCFLCLIARLDEHNLRQIYHATDSAFIVRFILTYSTTQSISFNREIIVFIFSDINNDYHVDQILFFQKCLQLVMLVLYPRNFTTAL